MMWLLLAFGPFVFAVGWIVGFNWRRPMFVKTVDMPIFRAEMKQILAELKNGTTPYRSAGEAVFDDLHDRAVTKAASFQLPTTCVRCTHYEAMLKAIEQTGDSDLAKLAREEAP